MIHEKINGILPRDDNNSPISCGLCTHCHLDESVEHEQVALFIWEGQSLCEEHLQKMYQSLLK